MSCLLNPFEKRLEITSCGFTWCNVQDYFLAGDLPSADLDKVIHAFIASRLDYCNLL